MKRKLQKYTAEVVETMPVNPSFRPEIGVGNIIKVLLARDVESHTLDGSVILPRV